MTSLQKESEWEERFDEKFDGLWLFLATEYKSFDAGKAPKESIKSFIESLLEQEKKRMSEEVTKVYEIGHNEDCIFCGLKDRKVLSIINKNKDSNI